VEDKMKYYTLESCQKLINRYIDLGGEVFNIEEGGVGLGTIVCIAQNKKTAIIQERYLNAWSSCHTIRFYNKTPAKYKKQIDK
jgi:hypothetical protein